MAPESSSWPERLWRFFDMVAPIAAVVAIIAAVAVLVGIIWFVSVLPEPQVSQPVAKPSFQTQARPSFHEPAVAHVSRPANPRVPQAIAKGREPVAPPIKRETVHPRTHVPPQARVRLHRDEANNHAIARALARLGKGAAPKRGLDVAR